MGFPAWHSKFGVLPLTCVKSALLYSCLCAKAEYTIFLPGNVIFRGIFFLNLGIVISIMVYYMGLSKAPPAVPI